MNKTGQLEKEIIKELVLILLAIFCFSPLSYADTAKERYVEFDY